MNKWWLATLALTTVACGRFSQSDESSADTIVADTVEIEETLDPMANIPAGAAALLRAYPDMIVGYEDNMLTMADGTKITYDDGREKDFDTMLDQSDPEDMFFVAYRSDSIPEYLADAGRSRCEQLFKSMYGNSQGAVSSRLVNVDWFGEKVRFTGVNGAADSLRAVARELANYPELKPYLASSGTFYWRQVRGANRLSAHSYGIAIDVGVPLSDYWLWKNPGAKETSHINYVNRMPRQLVEVFERHGFVWGGAWYHFDTMHFEFRPEILAYARR